MKIALVAGELSGDYLGQGVIKALLKRFPDAQFEGIGGPHMQAAGLRSLFPLDALSVMGLVEVIRHLPRLLLIREQLRRRWKAQPPDVFIGIDAPDFNLGLAAALRKHHIPTAQYVSPTVWAWRGGRIKKIRRAVDRMLCIYPFEHDFFKKAGVESRFVGHPLADEIPLTIDHASARAQYDLKPDAQWVALLPGSRKSEVTRLLPLFLEVAQRLRERHPDLNFIVPAATPLLAALITRQLKDQTIEPAITVVEGGARAVLAAADAGLIASGTATLEAMLLRCPSVMAYRVNALTAGLARRSVQIEWFAMPNLMAGEMLMPEFVQAHATPALITPALSELLAAPERRALLETRFADLHARLRGNASESVALAIAELLADQC